MSGSDEINWSGYLTNFTASVTDDNLFKEFSVQEVYMQESILSPQLHMQINVQAASGYPKNFYNYKLNGGQPVTVQGTIVNPTYNMSMNFSNMILYRIGNRKPFNTYTEEFTISCCHNTTITNQLKRMTKIYKDVNYASVVQDAFNSAGATGRVGQTDSKGNYSSDNKHPFQVISDMSSLAMKGKTVPFVHYMTFENGGTHYWQAVTDMLSQGSAGRTFGTRARGRTATMSDPNSILTHEFPCDFDTLLEAVHGIPPTQSDYANLKPSILSINPLTGQVFMVDGRAHGNPATQGMGGAATGSILNNLNNRGDTSSGGEKNTHQRTPLMAFLQRENIAIKILVPLAPELHIGGHINVQILGLAEGQQGQLFGSGTYMIAHLTHNIKFGAYATTSLECIKISDSAIGVRPTSFFGNGLLGFAQIQGVIGNIAGAAGAVFNAAINTVRNVLPF